MEFYAYVEQFKQRENLQQGGTARLTAMIASMFTDKSSVPPSYEDFLPFRPPRRYLTVEEAEVMATQVFAIKDAKED